MISLTIDFDSDKEKLRFYQTLKALKGKFNVEIKRFQKARSLNQNRYYWKYVVGEISAFTGFTKDEAHEALRMLFLREDKVIRATGESIPASRSTTDLTTAEFEEYCEQVRIWALNTLDVYIPLPNETI